MFLSYERANSEKKKILIMCPSVINVCSNNQLNISNMICAQIGLSITIMSRTTSLMRMKKIIINKKKKKWALEIHHGLA